MGCRMFCAAVKRAVEVAPHRIFACMFDAKEALYATPSSPSPALPLVLYCLVVRATYPSILMLFIVLCTADSVCAQASKSQRRCA